MSHAQIPPLAADVAALLASERTIEPQPDSVRRRALLRARAADRWQGRSSAPSAVRLWRWARRAPSVAAMASCQSARPASPPFTTAPRRAAVRTAGEAADAALRRSA